MKFITERISIIIIVIICYSISTYAQSLSEKLKILEPLAGKKWTGMLKSPDGKNSWKTTHEFSVIWDGKVVKYKGATPEIKSYSEGFYVWDELQGKIVVFISSSNGVYSSGYISVEGNIFTITGVINFPERKFDFKNTFELTPDGKLIDKWFQNAFGPWRPGHVVELKAVME